VATCVVTDRAKKKWVKEVSKMLREGTQVFLTGCGAFERGRAMDYDAFFEVYPELEKFRENLVLLGEDPEQYDEHLNVADYELNREFYEWAPHKKTKFLGKSWAKKSYTTRKYIVIQSGCDTFCSFCLTIRKRGAHRNRNLADILAEIDDFVAGGGQEIILTGVNLAARGASHTRKPEESRFSELLEAIVEKTAVPRIRISSLGPEFLDAKFFALMKNPRFLPHFHFSIQSFSTPVLAGMNRNYDEKVLDEVLRKIRAVERPDADKISIGADIIVGFPSETEEEFQKTFAALEKYGVTKLHAFPFSAHQKGETVPAAALENQVEQGVKKARERALIAEGERVRENWLAQQRGKKFQVLLESAREGVWTGWTENYISVEVAGDFARGQVVEVEL